MSHHGYARGRTGACVTAGEELEGTNVQCRPLGTKHAVSILRTSVPRREGTTCSDGDAGILRRTAGLQMEVAQRQIKEQRIRVHIRREKDRRRAVAEEEIVAPEIDADIQRAIGADIRLAGKRVNNVVAEVGAEPTRDHTQGAGLAIA